MQIGVADEDALRMPRGEEVRELVGEDLAVVVFAGDDDLRTESVGGHGVLVSLLAVEEAVVGVALVVDEDDVAEAGGDAVLRQLAGRGAVVGIGGVLVHLGVEPDGGDLQPGQQLGEERGKGGVVADEEPVGVDAGEEVVEEAFVGELLVVRPGEGQRKTAPLGGVEDAGESGAGDERVVVDAPEQGGDGAELARAGRAGGGVQSVAELCCGAEDAGAGLLAHADLLRPAVQDNAGRADGHPGGLGDFACRNAFHADILA